MTKEELLKEIRESNGIVANFTVDGVSYETLIREMHAEGLLVSYADITGETDNYNEDYFTATQDAHLWDKEPLYAKGVNAIAHKYQYDYGTDGEPDTLYAMIELLTDLFDKDIIHIHSDIDKSVQFLRNRP